MNDPAPIYPSIDASRPRKGRLSLLVVLIALAFAAGLALMAYAMRGRTGWFGGAATQPKTALVTQAESSFMPSQPLTADQIAARTAPSADLATLEAREATLAGQLAAMEARTASVTADAAAAGGQAGRAEAMLVAFAARRAIDRGQGLGYLEEQLKQRFGTTQPRAVAIVVQASRQPVTLEDLRQALDAIAADLASGTGDGDWWTGLRRELGSLVILRKAGAPSPLPEDRLARARRLLDGGQVEAALAEVSRLPGADQAANWANGARRYVLTRRALDAIENSAVMGQGVTQQPPVPAAVALPAG